MKRLFLLLSLLFCISCVKYGESVEYSGKDNYNVEYIFTVQNVKIYRFEDGGRHHYLAIGNGKVLNTLQSQSNGKSTSYWDDAVITEENN